MSACALGYSAYKSCNALLVVLLLLVFLVTMHGYQLLDSVRHIMKPYGHTMSGDLKDQAEMWRTGDYIVKMINQQYHPAQKVLHYVLMQKNIGILIHMPLGNTTKLHSDMN